MAKHYRSATGTTQVYRSRANRTEIDRTQLTQRRSSVLAHAVARYSGAPRGGDRVACLLVLRRFAEAEQLLLAEVAKNPHLVALADELTSTYWQMGRRDDSVALYERALEISPRNRNLLDGRANALPLAGRLDE